MRRPRSCPCQPFPPGYKYINLQVRRELIEVGPDEYDAAVHYLYKYIIIIIIIIIIIVIIICNYINVIICNYINII